MGEHSGERAHTRFHFREGNVKIARVQPPYRWRSRKLATISLYNNMVNALQIK